MEIIEPIHKLTDYKNHKNAIQNQKLSTSADSILLYVNSTGSNNPLVLTKNNAYSNGHKIDKSRMEKLSNLLSNLNNNSKKYIFIKNGNQINSIINHIRKNNQSNNCTIISQDRDTLNLVKSNTEFKSGYIFNDYWAYNLLYSYASNFDSVFVNKNHINNRTVRQANNLDIDVYGFGIYSNSELKDFSNLGLSGYINYNLI